MTAGFPALLGISETGNGQTRFVEDSFGIDC